ncbi:MAG: ribosomal protein S18-alanine N-acetyltransferase [Clostridia bacterium]|nr:ribosomal protein S18-alanine N-acetyltransferase [Clostridia bacterium]
MQINKMDISDIDDVLNLEKSQDINILSKDSLLSDLKNESSRYYILKLNEKIVGYIGSKILVDSLDIESIVIKKDLQNKGYGKILLKHVIEVAKNENIQNIFLEVRCSNIPAIKLYEKFGFKKLNVRKNYYKNPVEDAAIYVLNLSIF